LKPVGPVTFDSVLVEVWDGEGVRLGSLGNQPDEEISLVKRPSGGGEYVADAYSGRLVTALWGDLVIASRNKPYEIRAFSIDGTLARIVRREHEPRSPAEADRQSYLERKTGGGGGPRPALPEALLEAILEERRQFFELVPLAVHFPAFSTIMVDETGHLWVREYDLPREEDPAPLWTVFDPEGRVLGFVETPEGLDILQIGEDYILGRFEDEFEVEYVQVWPLER